MNDDRLKQIFDTQRELGKKFHQIECENLPLGDVGFVVNLSTYAGQARMRELISRISIECTEQERSEPDTDESMEEVADILSFLVEAFIAAGYTEADIAPHCGSTEHDRLFCHFGIAARMLERLQPFRGNRYYWASVHDMAWYWANILKAKPWKRNPKPTDLDEFKRVAEVVFGCFLQTCILLNIDEEKLCDAYFRKHSENESRITQNS